MGENALQKIKKLRDMKTKTDQDGRKCLSRSLGGILHEDFFLGLLNSSPGLITCQEKEAEKTRLLSKFENNPLDYFAMKSVMCGPICMKELAKLSIMKMAKEEEEADKLAAILETIWPERHLSYYDILTNINQGNTQDMENCIGPVKSHPRICSFLMYRDFEFRPVPNPQKQNEITFKEFLQKNNECLKSQDSFELCKENFCNLSDCSGKILPDYEDFHDEL
jgi:hypothetical protein